MTDEGINPETLKGRPHEKIEALKGARVLDHPLDRLVRGKLSQDRYDAGMRLYADYIMSQPSGSSELDGTPAPKQFFSSTPTDKQLDAGKRYDNAMDSLPRPLREIVKQIVIKELSFESVARIADMSRHAVAGALYVGLDSLMEHYEG